MKITIDLDRLADLALDLESGHPIEAVLRKHGIHERWSAYDVVIRQQKNRRFLMSATNNAYQKQWAEAVKELEPCIKAMPCSVKALGTITMNATSPLCNFRLWSELINSGQTPEM